MTELYKIMDSTINQIETRIRSWQRGSIFFISDFADLGSTEAVRQALNRLTKAGVILRPGRGVYCYPEIMPAIPELGIKEGVRTPSVDEIAQAIAKRDCCRICPTAPVAQHYLRLSQQVPMNVVYFTDGSGRRIPMGSGHGILFKHTSDMKLFSYQSDLMRLLVVSMKDIGEGMLNAEELRVIGKHLENVSEVDFNNDIKLAPDWIRAELQKLYVVH